MISLNLFTKNVNQISLIMYSGFHCNYRLDYRINNRLDYRLDYRFNYHSIVMIICCEKNDFHLMRAFHLWNATPLVHPIDLSGYPCLTGFHRTLRCAAILLLKSSERSIQNRSEAASSTIPIHSRSHLMFFYLGAPIKSIQRLSSTLRRSLVGHPPPLPAVGTTGGSLVSFRH